MLKQFVIICFGSFLLLTSCKCNSSSTNDSATNTTTASSETMMAKDTAAAVATNPTPPNDSTSAASNNSTASTTESGNTTGKSLYKNGKSHTRSVSGTPGYFPEGSDRLLTVKDVEYLSDWGMAIIENEIYARHGMLFSDDMLGKHFKDQKWYHPVSHNVESKLTKIEKENLEFIRNYKANPKGAA